MADNDEASGSRPHAGSEEEDLENHYLQYFSQDLEDDGYEGMDNNTTDIGGAGTDGTTSGSASAKRQRKERRQNLVGTGRQEITEVDVTSGLPIQPENHARGFGNTCAAIA